MTIGNDVEGLSKCSFLAMLAFCQVSGGLTGHVGGQTGHATGGLAVGVLAVRPARAAVRPASMEV